MTVENWPRKWSHVDIFLNFVAAKGSSWYTSDSKLQSCKPLSRLALGGVLGSFQGLPLRKTLPGRIRECEIH